jgi:hypothetical protein
MRTRLLIAVAAAVVATATGCQTGSQTAMTPATMEQMRAQPMMWCRNSPEPARCRGRAGAEQDICLQYDPANYMNCRFAMDQMHGP